MILDPMPSEKEVESWYALGNYYQGDSRSGYDYSYFERIKARYNDKNSWPYRLLARATRLGGQEKAGRLLDVGCGGGLFAACAKRVGWNAQGLDPNPAAVEAAARYGVPVRTATIEESGFDANTFDIIYANDVIEHVLNPIKAFEEIDRLLLPRGVLILSTPNGDRALLRPNRWGGFQSSLEHLWYFNTRSMKRLCGIVNLDVHAVEQGDWNPKWLCHHLLPLLGLGRTLTLIAGKAPNRTERRT
jgi:2-polyprenyl-3-methyl-5-hydroxy-6-metoxy-1,4-benzoquinol methylase